MKRESVPTCQDAGTAQRLARLRVVSAAATTCAVLGLAALLWWNDALLLEWKRDLNPVAFFIVLSLGGALGLPTTPFYLLGGALYGWAVATAGTAVAVLSMQTLAYLIARGPLRHWSEQLALAAERRFARGPLSSPAARVLLVRLLPLVPSFVKSYASASVGVRFGVYLAVSWPVGFGYAAAMVLLGDSAITGNPWEAALGLGLVLGLGLIAAWARRHRWVASERS